MSHPEIAPLYDAETVVERVREVGSAIAAELAHDDPVVVALLPGSEIFLADLVRAIEIPLRFEFIRVEYRHGRGEEEPLGIHFPIPVDVAGENILLLKDIVGSGVIETYLSNELRSHGARSVRFAALIDLPEERTTNFELDYFVFSTQRAGRLVGYGLKYNGRLGNLPYVGRVVVQ